MRRILTSSSFWLLVALVLVAGIAVVTTRDGYQPPALVVDEAQLFTTSQSNLLADYHRFLLTDHDIDYRVMTSAQTSDIASYSLEQFTRLNVGEQSRSGRGLLLVIDTRQDRVRLEVSRALEGVFTDAFVTYIQQRQMVPFFRDNRIADGILATTELIYAESQRAESNAGFDPREQSPGTTGAGAETAARIGVSASEPVRTGGDVVAGDSPAETVAAYLSAMRERNGDPNLDIFTAESRTMLGSQSATPAQMDTVFRTYRNCTGEDIVISPSANRAVLRYPPRQRSCAPWFLINQGGKWRLDLTMLQRAVRFGRSNAWHFDVSVNHPYEFAFQDWRFDDNGFPISRN